MSDLDVALRLRLVNGLKAGSAEAKRDLAGIGTAAQKLGRTRGVDQLGLDIEKTSVRAKRLERQLDGLRRSRGLGIGTDLDAAAKSAGRLDTIAKRLAGNLDKARGSAAGLRREFESMAGAAERAGRASLAVRRMGGRGGRASAAAQAEAAAKAGMGSSVAAGLSGGAAARFGARAAGLGGGAFVAGDVLRQSYKSAADFERAMIEVGKATNTSGADLDTFGEKLMKLARETGVTKEGLANMLAGAGFAGRPAEELMRFNSPRARRRFPAWKTSSPLPRLRWGR